jgi:protein TonB
VASPASPASAASPTPAPEPAPGAVHLPTQVDSEPRPIEMPMPVYPSKALKDRVRGVVVLRVLVSQNGEPLEVKVEREARQDLTDAAIAAVKQWRFEPARKDGYRVRAYTRVRIPFEGVQFARTPLPGFAATPEP